MWLHAQMKAQVPLRVALGRFYNECDVRARQRRHIELDLRVAEWTGFRGKCGGPRRPLHSRCDFRPFYGVLGLVSYGNLQKRALARKPGSGVEQLHVVLT